MLMDFALLCQQQIPAARDFPLLHKLEHHRHLVLGLYHRRRQLPPLLQTPALQLPPVASPWQIP